MAAPRLSPISTGSTCADKAAIGSVAGDDAIFVVPERRVTAVALVAHAAQGVRSGVCVIRAGAIAVDDGFATGYHRGVRVRLHLGLLIVVGCAGRHEILFEKRVLDMRFLSEGVTVFDVDRDGRLDIVSYNQWFRAPDFTPQPIGPGVPLDPASQYSLSFVNQAMDVDGDGWTDLVVFGFPLTPAFWLRNPGGVAGAWAEFPVWDTAPQESPRIEALTPDVGPLAIFSPDPTHIGVFAPGTDRTQPWAPRLLLPLGPDAMPLGTHGMGIGDIDGDGRPDLVTPRGYWSMPASIDDPWSFTAVDLGPDCAQMRVLDVNGDGLPDVVTSSAHNFGVFWHEQRRDGSFARHTIYEKFSQSHALEVADINNDGLPDLVTGKRMWAHGPSGDVDPGGPRVLYWFEQVRDGDTHFVPHLIDDDSGVGTQFVVTDVDGDGRADIVTANKHGTFYFHQLP